MNSNGILIKQLCNTTMNNTRRLISQNMPPNIKTAGIIVIGDEILKGEVLDTNSNYITKSLHTLGIKVNKISVIGDYVDDICKETLLFSKSYDYVITTGGIGPTHDDVTFAGIAKAFQEKLVPHPELVKICARFYQTTNLEAPGMKLAFVPESAKLNFPEDKNTGVKVNYPNVSVKNVYIFPGIPQLLQKAFDILGPQLFSSESRFYSKNIYFNVTEQLIVNVLEELVREFPNVMFGSYPEMFNSNYKVKVTIESTDEVSTTAASEKLLQLVPKDFVVNTNNVLL